MTHNIQDNINLFILSSVFAGMLNGLMGTLADIICCKFKWGQYKSPRYDDIIAGQATVPAASPLLQTDVIDSVLSKSGSYISANSNDSSSDDRLQQT